MEGILFKIEAKDNFSNVTSKAKTEIQEIGGTANESSTSVNNFGSKMTSLVGITTAVVAGVAAVGAAMYKLVQTYGEAEQVQLKFNFAMQQFGVSANMQMKLEQLASNTQKLIGLSDEATKEAAAYGLQMGIESQYIERATKAAINLSLALGIDLNSAMRMLARGTEGNIGALGRYIPALSNLNLESANTEQILAAVESRVGGISEAMAGSVVANTNRLKETFGDLKEEIGRGLAPAINSITSELSRLIEKMTQAIKQTNDYAEIQKTATFQALYAAQSQAVYEKAIKEGWIGDFTRLSVELEKVRQRVAAEVNKWNAYQSGVKTETTTETPTIVENAIITELKAQIKALEAKVKDLQKQIDNLKTTGGITGTEYFLPMTDVWDFWLGNMNDEFVYIIEETANNIEEVVENIQRTFGNAEELAPEENTGTNEVGNILSTITGFDFSSIEGFLVSLVMATDTIQMIGGLIQPLITMVSSVLYPVLVALIPLFDLVYSILGPLLKLFVPILAVLAAIVNNLIETFKAFGLLVYYIVTFQWGKLGSIKPNYMTTADINAIIATANAGISGATTTTTTGTGASYTAAATYHINVYVNTAALVGDTGIDEFAMLIWEKINLAKERE